MNGHTSLLNLPASCVFSMRVIIPVLKETIRNRKNTAIKFSAMARWSLAALSFGQSISSPSFPSAGDLECTIDVPPPEDIQLDVENGINARSADDLTVLWLDAHPDIQTKVETPNAHVMVLEMLVGERDEDFVKQIKRPIKPENIRFYGLYDMSSIERKRYEAWGLKMATPNDLFDNSDKVLDWLQQTGAKCATVHFDLDVIDLAQLCPLWFSRPHAKSMVFCDIAQGRMEIAEIICPFSDASQNFDVVGLGITEFLPWDMQIMRDFLCQLPILSDDANR